MINPNNIDVRQMQRVVNEGAPVALRALGYVMGLSGPEQDHLASKGVPTLFWVTLSLGAGVLIGARLTKAGKMPRVISG